MKTGRNDPCPCGSGKKYKKCHLAQDQAALKPAPQEALSVSDIAKRMADRFLVSDGVDDETMAVAERYFDEKDAGRGPAQQMMDFSQPLIDTADGSTEGLNKALTMGMFFWNLAISPEDEREKTVAEMSANFDDADADARTAFQEMAKVMIERHQEMFPEQHRR
jgi:hypothetical protein